MAPVLVRGFAMRVSERVFIIPASEGLETQGAQREKISAIMIDKTMAGHIIT